MKRFGRPDFPREFYHSENLGAYYATGFQFQVPWLWRLIMRTDFLRVNSRLWR